MQAAVQSDHVSVEDYPAAEEKSDIRRKYLGGLVHAMSGRSLQLSLPHAAIYEGI